MSWRALIRVAATVYGVQPEAFWRLSLREWRALTTSAGADGGPPLTRREFDALLDAYPDRSSSVGANR